MILRRLALLLTLLLPMLAACAGHEVRSSE